ncbi:MAG: Flp pilus assembly complex ATPase component TadA [Candidatus Omnitrophica bacterium]|nr:Flp pilus assembly complex ATPase component TadA [Candidatus Omnitrophota bacterium]
MLFKPKVLFGQILLQNNIINEEQLNTALAKQKETGDLLGVTLMKMGFVDEEAIMLPLLAEQLDVDFISLKEKAIKPDIIRRVPAKFATYYKVLPLSYQDEALTIATPHPLDINIIDGIGLVTQGKIHTILASEKDIMEGIRKYYGVGAETIDKMMDSVDVEDALDQTVDNIEEIDSDASIGKFINQILLQAYKDRATDIHIEPYENDLKIRYRVDGILYDTQLPTNIWHFRDAINSRIKIMSNLNIAEKRLPQDGRFKVKVGVVDLDLRVSFLPTPYGESVVIRILSSTKLYNMRELGLAGEKQNILNELIKKPHGIIFVTGPTGSGKTTTLYSCLSNINNTDRKIITIEDPIEYQLAGTTQVQINPGIGLTFAAGLRSMLRHDPDIMMVGEVRDLETAEIAVQVALTGHLVLSTLHTNDAASGITRLIDMGVEPYLITSSVECFIAQRLVRLICPKCKKKMKVSVQVAQELRLDSKEISEGFTLFEGEGCDYCNFTGFYGREGIYEFLKVDEAIKEMIMNKASVSKIKSKAIESGMQPLIRDGWNKVRQGLTTPSEVIRVTKEETN